MTDPYETLDIERTSTDEEIRGAYRRKASAAHPDRVGGDVAKMQQVNEAYAVLSDSARRERFDKTGKSEVTVGIDHEAREVLLSLFAKALDAQGDFDLLAEVAKAISDQRMSFIGQKSQVQSKRAHLFKKVGKYKVKQGTNHLQALIDQQIAQLDGVVQAIEHASEVWAAADEMLRDYEGPPPSVQVPQFNQFAYPTFYSGGSR